MYTTIYDYILQEENAYNNLPIQVTENYEWSMREHINTTVLYKNSQYVTGGKENKPFKNITRPILNLQYRSETLEVKDIVLFVDQAEKYFMSFLVRKYHDDWAREHHIDAFLKSLGESYVDFGGTLVKEVNQDHPEVVKLQTIAFCDQTDILGGPIGLKHFFSPDQLLKMAKVGWGDEKRGATATLQDVIALSNAEKKQRQTSDVKTKTPGRYVEVYEVHGYFPTEWLEYRDDMPMGAINEKDPDTEFSLQMHIVVMMKKDGSNANGITLFCGPEKESIFKFLSRDPIYGRALGLGGAEELFDPQVWINYDVIRMTGMLDSGSKILYQTTDPAFANRNKTSDLDNGEILIVAAGAKIEQINTLPVNITVFENSVKDWEAQAQMMGGATDAILGNQPASGTPFNLQNLVTQQSQGLHEYRRGEMATFVDEIYRDWVIPQIEKKIVQDQKFLANLDLDELQNIAENVSIIQTNAMKKEMILSGKAIDPSMVDQYQATAKQQFLKMGTSQFVSILAGEFKNAPLAVKTDVAGKQKDLNALTEKLTKVFQTIAANPAMLDDPRLAKIFNQILESSGLSPIDFSTPAGQGQGGGASGGASDKNQPKGPSESIAYKDLPPDGKVQMAKQAGITITTPAPEKPAAEAPAPKTKMPSMAKSRK